MKKPTITREPIFGMSLLYRLLFLMTMTGWIAYFARTCEQT